MGPVNTNLYCCSPNNILPQAIMNLDTLDFKHMNYSDPETYKKLQIFSKEFAEKQGLDPRYSRIIVRILGNKQQHVLLALKTMQTKIKKERFLRQIDEIDLEQVDWLNHNVLQKIKISNDKLEHCDYSHIEIIKQQRRDMLFHVGLNIIKTGKVGLLLLAGGSSNRFQSNKFLKETTFSTRKCILELILMRLHRVVQLSGKEWSLPVFIMCSDQNYSEIKNFLRKNSNFGVPDRYLDLFVQRKSIPVLSSKGQIILNSNMNVILNPRGTGEFVHALTTFKLKDKIISELKLNYIYISGLENALERPCDPFLIGSMINADSDVVAKCVQPISANEPLLRYAKVNGVVKGIQPSIFERFKNQQNFKQRAPIVMNSMVINTAYIDKLISQPNFKMISKNVHTDERKFTFMDLRDGTLHISQQCFIFENHISDLFFASNKILLMKVVRQQEYAPVITESEEYSLFSAQGMISNIIRQKKSNPNLTSFKLFSKQEIQNSNENDD